ncbi:MAG: HDOD domain-containing protein [Desulfovibrio sp.]
MIQILFIDDEQDILDGIRAMLRRKRKEWEMHYCTSPIKALQLLDEIVVDIIVSDIRMPEMDGVAFLHQLKQHHPHPIKIVLSGQTDQKNLFALVKLAHVFLLKPCNSNELIETIEKVLKLRHLLQHEGLREKVNNIETLPVVPETFSELTTLLEDKDVSMKEISDLIAQDVSVSSTILKTVNSAFFGLFGSVKDIHRAVPLLGIDIVKGLILGVHTISNFRDSELETLSLNHLWKHSFNTALIAREIAKAESMSKADVETSYVAGLLHDIGKLLFAQVLPDEYKVTLNNFSQSDKSLYAEEQLQLNTTHAELGAYLLNLWRMPEEVVIAVNNHHTFAIPEEGFRPAHCVNIANHLEHKLVVYNKDYTFSPLCIDELERLHMSDRLDQWEKQVARLLEEPDA